MQSINTGGNVNNSLCSVIYVVRGDTVLIYRAKLQDVLDREYSSTSWME